MARLQLVLALPPVVFCGVLAASCSQNASGVAMRMSVTQGALDCATEVTLSVMDAEEVSCDESDGNVKGSPSEDGVQTFELDTKGCKGSAKWCADITLDKDGDDKVFEVVARGAGRKVGVGCTTAAVDQDPLEVSITVFPFIAPSCCNDGVVQFGETCDSGVVADATCQHIPEDAVCLADCRAKEIVLSDDAGTDPNIGNAAAQHLEPAFAFAGGSALGGIPNSFRAVWEDAPGGDINYRILKSDMMPLDDLRAHQLRLVDACDNLTDPTGFSARQLQPDITRLSDDKLLIAYVSEIIGQLNSFHINVLRRDSFGCDEGLGAGPTAVSFAEGVLTHPAVAAGPAGAALVVWLDGSNMTGRIWIDGNVDAECNAEAGAPQCLPLDGNILLAGGLAAGSHPRVAGGSNGWWAVYASAGSITLKHIDANGVVGGDLKVNALPGTHDRPDIAMLPDGRFAVVWQFDGKIMLQRYSADGQPVAGDQDEPINISSVGAATDPAIADGDTFGAFFAATWVIADGSAWARYIGADASRFLSNPLDGTSDDFPASEPSLAGQRVTPQVAVGGSGFVAFGWADLAPGQPGVRVRRFPLPVETGDCQ